MQHSRDRHQMSNRSFPFDKTTLFVRLQSKRQVQKSAQIKEAVAKNRNFFHVNWHYMHSMFAFVYNCRRMTTIKVKNG